MDAETLFREYVQPIYLSLVGPKDIYDEPVEVQEEFKQKLFYILDRAGDAVVTRLLQDLNWRSALVGGWLVFFQNRIAFIDTIGRDLVKGRGGVIGYCYALAKLGTTSCSEYLVSYLDKQLYFEKFPRETFQDTAMYALVYIDNKNNTIYSRRFLAANGSYTRFIEFKYLGGKGLNSSSRWGDFEGNYKGFVRSLEGMTTLTER